MKRYIKLIITDENGRSETTCHAPNVTDVMLEAAGVCNYTLLTGKRYTPPKKRRTVRK